MKDLARRLCELLDRREPLVVATIVSREGSTPRTAGSKMLVGREGRVEGTIGGGKPEADVLQTAARVLTDGRPRWMSFDLNRPEAADADMICGGTMEVLVDPVDPVADDRAVFDAWEQALHGSTPVWLVTILHGRVPAVESTDHCLISRRELVAGRWSWPRPVLEGLWREIGRPGHPRILEIEGLWMLVEPTRPPDPLYIFGAGHVSQPTVSLAAEVGFRVVVADDRGEYANRQRFPQADQIRVLESFDDALGALEVGPDAYLVIVTRGHHHDRRVLGQCLKTDAAYIGMIGSRRKRDAILARLRDSGFTESDLARVHCPIGLPIGAETPAEIAVSIVAELIAHRARRQEAGRLE